MSSARRAVAPIVLLLLYAALCLAWLIVVPPFDAQDEIAHYDHARYIAATGHLPDHVPTALREGDWYLTHWPQPPLYYLLLSVVIRATHAEAVAPLRFVAFDPADHTLNGPSARRILFQEPADGLATRALLRCRLVSAACGAGLVLALFAALGTAGASDRTRVLLIASLLFVPAFTANLAVVNNDALAALCAALGVAAIFGLAARSGQPDRRGLARWFGTGLIVGLALSSKSTTVFLVPMAAASAVMGAPRSWRIAIGRLGAIAAGLAVCLSASAVRNWIVFGDPFASELANVLRRFHPPSPSWTLWGTSLYVELSQVLYEGFVGQFGYSLAMPRDADVWLLYRSLLIVAIVLCLIAIAGVAASRRDTSVSVPIARLALVGVIAHAVALYTINTMFNATSGRHVLPVVVPAITLVYLGGATIARALARRGLSAPTRLVPAALLVLLAAAWVTVFVEMAMRFRFGG